MPSCIIRIDRVRTRIIKRIIRNIQTCIIQQHILGREASKLVETSIKIVLDVCKFDGVSSNAWDDASEQLT